MMQIDVDHIHDTPRFDIQKILYSMPRPFHIRLSSSREGLHLRVPACGKWDYRRYAYDDPMRIQLDEQREHAGLPVSNLLWDVKNGKNACDWRAIMCEREIEHFLDTIETKNIYARGAMIYVCTGAQR